MTEADTTASGKGADQRPDFASGAKRGPLPAGVLAVIGTVAVSTIGALAMATALGKLVYDITGRALDLGLIGLAEFLPTAILAPLVGPMADRYDRRKVVAAGLLGEAACAMGMALYAASGPTRVWPVFLLIAGYGTARAAVAPALRSLPADLAGAQLARVIPLNSAAWQLAVIVGPVLAGFLYLGGPAWPFVFGTASLLIAMVAVLQVPDVRHTSGQRAAGETSSNGPLHEALEGLRFVRRTPILLGAISLDLFAVLFGGAVALLPAIAETRLGVGSVGLGWLRASCGIGAGSTTLLLAWRPLSRGVGRALMLAVAIFGIFTVLLAFTTNFAVAFIALAVLSSADAISVFVRGTLVPLATPAIMRGRVSATENVFIGASNELGAFESGLAGHLFGVVGAVALGGVATLVIVGVWWWCFPALRKVDRFEEVMKPA